MVIKEPRDGSHFDLSCPKEGLVYCLVDIDEIKPVPLTPMILEDNGWEKDRSGAMKYYKKVNERFLFCLRATPNGWTLRCGNQDLLEKTEFVHQLQHLLLGIRLDTEMEV